MTEQRSITLTLGAGPVEMAVLSRVGASVAASMDLGIDRVTEAALVLEHIVDIARRRRSGVRINVVFTPVASGLDVRVGPIDPGFARDIIASPTSGSGALVARVVNGSHVETGDGGDDLVLAFRHPVPQA